MLRYVQKIQIWINRVSVIYLNGYRPLPQELIDYAREDTHYLLYIYDMMKNQLIEKGNDQKNLLHSTLDKSRIVCCKVSSSIQFRA